MYHRKRDNTTIWSNCTFNHDTEEGYSYGWWQVSGWFGDMLLFNNYSYSISTNKHQGKILEKIGYGREDVLYVEAPGGLQQGLEHVRSRHMDIIKGLEYLIAKPRTHKKKNEERREEIRRQQSIVSKIETLQGRKENNAPFVAAGMVAAFGNVLCADQEEKNNWKKRMLQAGITGLSIPEDWEDLTEDEKTRRLDEVINQINT